MTCGSLQSMRTEVNFKKLFSAAEKMCSDLIHWNISKPHLPRQRRPPSRYSGKGDCHQWNSPEEFFRSHYFAVIDAAVNGLRTRYTQPGLQRYIGLEKVLTLKGAAAAELPLDIVSATAGYPELCAESLSTQLRMYEQQGWSRCSLSDVVTQLNSLQPALRCMFSQMETLVKLLLTIPCSNAEAERSFSCLRRVKTYLRNSMNQERLNHVAVLHVHKERTDDLDLVQIANDFVNKCDTRQQLFGSFE